MNNRMHERRVLKRRHLVVYLDVVDRMTGTVLGQLGDISVEGLLVISRTAIPADKTWSLRVALPDLRGYRGEYLDVDGLLLEQCGHQSRACLYGFSFVDLDDAGREKILSLIQVLGFRD